MKPAKDSAAARQRVLDALEAHEIDMRTALARLRRAIGMSQARYAKLVGVAPRVLVDFERGVGNPTLESLRAIGKPFGLEVGFVRRRRA